MDQRAGTRPRDLRASDADREGVVDVLTTAAAEGRLCTEEHDERIKAAYAARTLGELADLLHDLPNGPAAAGLPDLDDRMVGVAFGRRDRTGRWVVPAELATSAVGGTVTLDFTDAMFAANSTVVSALCLGGAVRMLVPRSVRVSVHCGGLVGLRKIRTRKTDRNPRFHLVVRARGVGQITVRTVG